MNFITKSINQVPYVIKKISICHITLKESMMDDIKFTSSYKIKDRDEDIIKDSMKQPTCLQNAMLYFCNFCENTSIHGLKFFGERRRNIFEKVYWLVVITAAVYASGNLIYKNYIKWITSPIVVTFAMTETPIWEVPFPAITICPETNADPRIFNYSDVYLKYLHNESRTQTEEEYFKLFSLVCKDAFRYIDENQTRYFSEEDQQKFLDSFAPMEAGNCKWLDESIDCNQSLHKVATSEGWCRTFNMLSYSDIYTSLDDVFEDRTINVTKPSMWSLENGYPPNAGLNAFPRRTMISGVNGGFQIDFVVKKTELDYICAELQGFKVAFHHPAETPDMDKYFRVPLDQAVVAAIRPRMIKTSNEIKTYEPEERNCYLPREKQLGIYKIYSQQNCLFECLTNFTLKKCGCTSFYMPVNTTACGAGSKECINKAKVEFLQQEVSSKLNKEKNKVHGHCGCLPACTSLEFDSETSQTDFDWTKKMYLGEYNVNDLKGTHYFSRLSVYYKDLQFMTSERHEMFGQEDFLANCGGLMGLCCGVSFVSLMEIAYYLTLRLLSNVVKFGRKFWSGSDELIQIENKDK